MRDIAIYGAGGLAREVACLIDRINVGTEDEAMRWRLVGFFEDAGYGQVGREVKTYGRVLGGMDELNAWPTPLSVAIAIGLPSGLQSVHSRIANPLVDFPNLIHPNFATADGQSFSMGVGNIIKGGCYLSCDTRIGSFNVLNGSVWMGHDATMGDYNACMPNVRISGNVHIGNCNLLGVGSIVIERIAIGHDVRLGAGAVLLTKPRDGGLYLGNPAKLFKY